MGGRDSKGTGTRYVEATRSDSIVGDDAAALDDGLAQWTANSRGSGVKFEQVTGVISKASSPLDASVQQIRTYH